MIVYKVTNRINNKSYIGKTICSLDKRRKKHIQDALANRYNMYFHSALKKYGVDNFDWDIIDECDDIDELNRLEIYYIGYYNTYNNGYNMTIGGEGMYGYKHTEKTRRELSEINKGKKHSEEHKKRISKSMKGRKRPEHSKFMKKRWANVNRYS